MKYLFAILIIAFSTPCLAADRDEWNKEITAVAVSIVSNRVFVTLKTNTELDCKYGRVVTFSLNGEAAKAAYSTALAAHAQNKKVRVIYNLPSPGELCTLYHIESFN